MPLLVFLLLYGVALVVQMPAGFALERLQPLLQQQKVPLQLQEVSGTLWSGRSEKVFYKKQPLGSVEWQFKPASLLLLQLGIEWRWQPQAKSHLEGQTTLTLDRLLTSREIRGQLEMTDLTRFVPFMPLVLNGQVGVDIPHLSTTVNDLQQLEGEVRWSNANTNVPTAISFGTVKMTLTTPELTVVQAKLDNSGGDMQLKGEAKFNAAKQLSWQLAAQIRPNAPDTLRNTLPLLKRPDPDGQFRFSGQSVIQY